MWYFAWILGVLLACSMGVLAAIWYELHQDRA
ncbi:MAG TPA: cytochrome bd-I oxidase subunit CydX [Mariprofundaceae bacterium]|nr:cytochrome bd-I oxidase subunit CydX [Mariprofundaceae bacterium]